VAFTSSGRNYLFNDGMNTRYVTGLQPTRTPDTDNKILTFVCPSLLEKGKSKVVPVL
jgi:hypothetical protein